MPEMPVGGPGGAPAVAGTGGAAAPGAWGSQPQEEVDPRRWLSLGVVLTAAFMVLLDISIVNVAIPSIQTNLGATFSQVQFVLAGYQLSYAVVLITGGRLGDLFGRKTIFMVGMAGFTIASAMCGLSPTPTFLVTSRVIQGVFAALMYPQVLSVIQVSFPPRERGAAFGIFGAVIGVATIAGPLMGGLIIRDDVTGSAWRWVFLVNLPIGVLSLVAAARLLHQSRNVQASGLDLPGVGIVTAGLLLLVYPLVEGRDAGWPAWAYISMIASPLVLGVFVLYERAVRRRGGSPLVDLTLFRVRSFAVGLLITILFFAGIPSFFFTFGLMLQIGLGFSALHAGLTTVPFAVASGFASAQSVRLAPKLGRSILLIGAALLTTGMVLVIATLHVRGTDLQGWELIPALMVSGAGLGSLVAPLLTVILAGIRGPQAGSASGVLTTTQQMGGALGVAIIGVIFFGLIGSRADQTAASVAATTLRPALSAAELPPPAQEGAVSSFEQCFHDRANSADPSVAPASCTPQAGTPQSPAAQTAFSTAGLHALGIDFSESEERTLLFNVLAFGVTGALVLLLPRNRPRDGGPAAGGAH